MPGCGAPLGGIWVCGKDGLCEECEAEPLMPEPEYPEPTDAELCEAYGHPPESDGECSCSKTTEATK